MSEIPFVYFFLPWLNSPQQAKASSFLRISDLTQTHHNQQDSSGLVTSPTQRPLPASCILLLLRFFRAFSSVVRQMPGHILQRRGTARTLPNQLTVLFCRLCCSMYCLCANVYCTTATGCQPNCSLQIYLIKIEVLKHLSLNSDIPGTREEVLQPCVSHFYYFVNEVNLVHNFSQNVYFFFLHVLGYYVPIIRRNSCIYATLGTCHSVWMTVWYAVRSALHTRQSSIQSDKYQMSRRYSYFS